MPENRADAFLRMIRHAQQGRLKIYLGYCAGVGKTYQMLLEGHRLKQDGFDVVVGLVETHGRSDTAKLIDGLEVIPRRSQEYHGITVEEMDVDAIIARKPQIALIDELAHTNVPGSRNAKRYHDVQDILAAGIHVISTLNIQHIESLYDTVEQAVGVKVRERIPDTVLADADQIVNVDLTTEDLLKRMREGKIYPAERVGTAMENFFTTPNLEQLRELALRELASQIDLRRREPVEDEITATPDQIMVALSSRGPNSERLLRYASRLAGKLNRNWYAVYVQTPSEEPTAIDNETHRMLSSALTLAKQLGAIVFTYKGEDVVGTILQFAQEYRVGHIVIGRPNRILWWKKLLGKRSVVDRLIHEARGVNIVILDTQEAEAAPARPLEKVPVPKVALSPITQPMTLSRLLSVKRIVIWNEPVTKDEVLSTLVDKVCIEAKIKQFSTVYGAVLRREEQGSTFLNEGVAFPHARLDGLSTPQVALGITQQGVSDIATEKPIQCVFLIITPASEPNTQLQILALASKTAQDRYLVRTLSSAATPEEVLATITDWELSQQESGDKVQEPEQKPE